MFWLRGEAVPMNTNVWKGGMLAVAVLFLATAHASALTMDMDAKMDQMKQDLDSTFDEKFSDSYSDRARTVDRDTRQTVERDSGSDRDTRQTVDRTPARQTDDRQTRSTADDTAERPSTQQSTGSTADTVERALHQALNQERQQHGLSSLSRSSNLAASASDKASDMAGSGYFSHDSPDGTTFQDRAAGAGCLSGETLAQTNTRLYGGNADDVADGIVQQWMNSPSHRDVVLGSRYSQHGAGVVVTDSGQVYAASHFC